MLKNTFNKAIVKNTESAWDEEFSFESNPMPITDDMGREKFCQDLGRPEESSCVCGNGVCNC